MFNIWTFYLLFCFCLFVKYCKNTDIICAFIVKLLFLYLLPKGELYFNLLYITIGAFIVKILPYTLPVNSDYAAYGYNVCQYI